MGEIGRMGEIGDRRHFRGYLLGVVALLLGVWLSGCQPGAPEDGVVHLTLWQGIGPPSNREVFQALVAHFNETHRDIEVDSLYVGQPDQQIPKILTAVVGNAAPDLLWYLPTFTGQLVELEAIQPLDDWFAQSPYRDTLDPALLATMRFEDHLWSVPFATNNAAIFYRPSLFEAAGVAATPKTWDELRQVAQRLTRDTNGDGRIDQHGIFLPLGKGEWTVFSWLPFIYSAGGHLIEQRQPDVVPDVVNEGAIAALQLGADLIQSGSAELSAPERGYDISQFLSGKVAMQITGPWVLPQLKKSGIDFDVFPFPVDQQPAAVLGGENFFLCQTTPLKTQATLTFLDYILSSEFQLPWALQTGYIPINRDTRDSQQYQNFVAARPSMKVFLDQMGSAYGRPLMARYSMLSENVGRAIEATFLGEPAQAALEAAQKRLDLIFDES